jgi:hypothetical protein
MASTRNKAIRRIGRLQFNVADNTATALKRR